MEKAIVQHFDEIESVPCPCGMSRRAFAVLENQTATMHQVDISADAKTHYHKKHTEIYLILETDGEAYVELDGQKVPVSPMSTIFIPPGVRHRAIGKMKIVNCCIPSFDSEDEWFD